MLAAHQLSQPWTNQPAFPKCLHAKCGNTTSPRCLGTTSENLSTESTVLLFTRGSSKFKGQQAPLKSSEQRTRGGMDSGGGTGED